MALRFQDLPTKDKISYVLCVASFICGTALTFCGMFISPIGEIDASVITSLGCFLSFSGALIGINTHYSTELHTFKTEVQRTIDEKQKSKEKENTDRTIIKD